MHAFGIVLLVVGGIALAITAVAVFLIVAIMTDEQNGHNPFE